MSQKFICEVLEINTFKQGTIKIRAGDGIHTCKILTDWDKIYDYMTGMMPAVLHDVDANDVWYITIGE